MPWALAPRAASGRRPLQRTFGLGGKRTPEGFARSPALRSGRGSRPLGKRAEQGPRAPLCAKLLAPRLQKVPGTFSAARDAVRGPAWALQIARRAVADHRRGRLSEKRLRNALRGLPQEAREVLERLDPASWLGLFLDRLPARDREVLRSTYWEGLSQKALAARLGISLSGARSRVQRARSRLHRTLLQSCSFQIDPRGNLLDCSPRRPGCCPDPSCE